MQSRVQAKALAWDGRATLSTEIGEKGMDTNWGTTSMVTP